MTLKDKIIAEFEGKVVRKDLVSLVKGNNPVPAYVLEYLLGQYCAIDDDEIISNGVEKVRNVIKDNYVHRSDAEVVKHKIRSAGSHKIIDKVNVVLNDKSDQYQAEFANLGLSRSARAGRHCGCEPKATQRRRCVVHPHHGLLP